MTKADNLRFRFWDPAGTVLSLIDRWRPIACVNERDYEASLYTFLHAELPAVQVTAQYALGRSRVDLMIGTKVAVEVKTDLATTNEFHRLLGQLDQMRSWDQTLVVLLTGHTDPYFTKELKEHVKDWIGSLPTEPKVHIVEKRAATE